MKMVKYTVSYDGFITRGLTARSRAEAFAAIDRFERMADEAGVSGGGWVDSDGIDRVPVCDDSDNPEA